MTPEWAHVVISGMSTLSMLMLTLLVALCVIVLTCVWVASLMQSALRKELRSGDLEIRNGMVEIEKEVRRLCDKVDRSNK